VDRFLTNLDASSLSTLAIHGSQKQIGTVASRKNAVQKRGAHTLIWDEARSDEALYEYDSVLTLSGSSASLNLGDSKLELDQDTLVVLEPSSEVGGGFKIRFSKGSSRSRNPSQPLKIVTESFEMTAAPGSSLLFSTLDDGRLHLDVEKGHVDMLGTNGTSSFESGETLLFKNGIVEEKKKITSDFEWSSAVPRRIYAERFPVKLKLGWSGDPQSVKVLAPQKPVETVHAGEDREQTVSLGEGKSFLWLEDGDLVSRKAEVEVLRVPSIHVFNPRMRDRVRTNDPIVFAWSANSDLKKYHVEISRQRDFQKIETSLETENPRVEHLFTKAGTYYWRITPIDEIGMTLPSTTPGEFSVVPVDLEAPKLNPAEIREPAEEPPPRGAMFWIEALIPRAWAKKTEAVAVFSWKPVQNAQYYQIEISTTPDFSVVVHSEKVTGTELEWHAAREKKYYWRVAAGRGDELGPFSEVDTVAVRAVAKAKVVVESAAETTPVPTPEPAPVTQASAHEQVPVATPPAFPSREAARETQAPVAALPSFAEQTNRKHGRFGLAPNDRMSKTTNQRETVGSFNGVVPLSVQAEFYLTFANQSRVELSGNFESVTWKPKETSASQGTLNETNSGLTLAYRTTNSPWAFGVGANSMALLKRKTNEDAELETVLLYGPSVRFAHVLGVGAIDIGIDARFGAKLNGGRASIDWIMPVFSKTFNVGPQLSYETFSGSGQSQEALRAGVYFGIAW
jgi:hypothetical protein